MVTLGAPPPVEVEPVAAPVAGAAPSTDESSSSPTGAAESAAKKRQEKKRRQKERKRAEKEAAEELGTVSFEDSLLWCIERLKLHLQEPGIDRTAHAEWCATNLKKLLDDKRSPAEKAQVMRHAFGDYHALRVKELAAKKLGKTTLV